MPNAVRTPNIQSKSRAKVLANADVNLKKNVMVATRKLLRRRLFAKRRYDGDTLKNSTNTYYISRLKYKIRNKLGGSFYRPRPQGAVGAYILRYRFTRHGIYNRIQKLKWHLGLLHIQREDHIDAILREAHMLLSIYRRIRRSGRNSINIKVRFFANKMASNIQRITTSRRKHSRRLLDEKIIGWRHMHRHKRKRKFWGRRYNISDSAQILDGKRVDGINVDNTDVTAKKQTNIHRDNKGVDTQRQDKGKMKGKSNGVTTNIRTQSHNIDISGAESMRATSSKAANVNSTASDRWRIPRKKWRPRRQREVRDLVMPFTELSPVKIPRELLHARRTRILVQRNNLYGNRHSIRGLNRRKRVAVSVRRKHKGWRNAQGYTIAQVNSITSDAMSYNLYERCIIGINRLAFPSLRKYKYKLRNKLRRIDTQKVSLLERYSRLICNTYKWNIRVRRRRFKKVVKSQFLGKITTVNEKRIPLEHGIRMGYIRELRRKNKAFYGSTASFRYRIRNISCSISRRRSRAISRYYYGSRPRNSDRHSVRSRPIQTVSSDIIKRTGLRRMRSHNRVLRTTGLKDQLHTRRISVRTNKLRIHHSNSLPHKRLNIKRNSPGIILRKAIRSTYNGVNVQKYYSSTRTYALNRTHAQKKKKASGGTRNSANRNGHTGTSGPRISKTRSRSNTAAVDTKRLHKAKARVYVGKAPKRIHAVVPLTDIVRTPQPYRHILQSSSSDATSQKSRAIVRVKLRNRRRLFGSLYTQRSSARLYRTLHSVSFDARHVISSRYIGITPDVLRNTVIKDHRHVLPIVNASLVSISTNASVTSLYQSYCSSRDTTPYNYYISEYIHKEADYTSGQTLFTHTIGERVFTNITYIQDVYVEAQTQATYYVPFPANTRLQYIRRQLLLRMYKSTVSTYPETLDHNISSNARAVQGERMVPNGLLETINNAPGIVRYGMTRREHNRFTRSVYTFHKKFSYRAMTDTVCYSPVQDAHNLFSSDKASMMYRHSVLVEAFNLSIYKRLIPLSIRSVLAYRSICDTNVCISYLADRIGGMTKRSIEYINRRIGFWRRTLSRNTAARISRIRKTTRVRASVVNNRRWYINTCYSRKQIRRMHRSYIISKHNAYRRARSVNRRRVSATNCLPHIERVMLGSKYYRRFYRLRKRKQLRLYYTRSRRRYQQKWYNV